MLIRIRNAWRALMSSGELAGRVEIVEDVLYGAMSTTDSEAIKATAELTTALCNNSCEAAVDAGSYVFFKIKNQDDEYQVFYKRLNTRDRKYLNSHPSALKHPMQLLDRLEVGEALEFERAAELRHVIHKMEKERED